MGKKSKLIEKLNSSNVNKITHTTSMTTESESNKELPKEAKIISKTVRTETEEIENGYILSKNYDISWENKDGNREYSYYTKKWFSKENPVKVVIDTPESLADKFN